MECAIVLGKRGFRRVHLVEAEAELGGTCAGSAASRASASGAASSTGAASSSTKLANVEVIHGPRLAAQDVREYGAEIVVVATGARWSSDGLNGVTHAPIPGADSSLAHVLTPEQVMLEGKRRPRRRASSSSTARGTSWRPGSPSCWPAEGRDVELVTPHDRVAPVGDETLEGPLLRQHLHESASVGARARCSPRSRRGASAEDEHGEPFELEADAVVLVTQRLSNEELYLELGATRRRCAPRRSRPSTGSATASRRGSSPRRSSTGTGSRREIDSREPARSRSPVPARAARARARSPVGRSGARPHRVPAPRPRDREHVAPPLRRHAPGGAHLAPRGRGGRPRARDRRVPAVPEGGRHRRARLAAPAVPRRLRVRGRARGHARHRRVRRRAHRRVHAARSRTTRSRSSPGSASSPGATATSASGASPGAASTRSRSRRSARRGSGRS